MGRAPASLWVARRGSQITILVHAMDGRVALGQVDGLAGCIPAAGEEMMMFQESTLWDLWGRHSGVDRHPAGEGHTPAARCKTRARFCVPISARVLAVLPRETEVLVLHQLEDKGHPQLWRVPLVSETGARMKSFVAMGSRASGLKGFPRCLPSEGPWYENGWHGKASGAIPEHVVSAAFPEICEFVEQDQCQPQFEFQRWQLLDANAAVDKRSWDDDYHPFRICKGGKRGVVGKGKGHFVEQASPRIHTTAPPPPSSGRKVDHWQTSARVT